MIGALVAFLFTSTQGAASSHERTVVLADDADNVEWHPLYTGERYGFVDVIEASLEYRPANDTVEFSLAVKSTEALEPRPAEYQVSCSLTGLAFRGEGGSAEEEGRFSVEWEWSSASGEERAYARWSPLTTGTGVGGSKEYAAHFVLAVGAPGHFVFSFDREFLLSLFDKLAEFQANCSMFHDPAGFGLAGTGGGNGAWGNGTYRLGALRSGENQTGAPPTGANESGERGTTENVTSPGESPGLGVVTAVIAVGVGMLAFRRQR